MRPASRATRLLLATALAVAVACVPTLLPGGAFAARPGLDPTFGDGGIARLRPPARLRHRRIDLFQSAVAPDGSVFEIADAPDCGSCLGRSWLLIRFDPRGGFDRSFGHHGVVSVPVPKNSFPDLTVDRRGRPLVDWRGDGTVLERFTVGGHVDRGFGGRGILRRPDIDSIAVVRPLPGGDLLLVGYEQYRGGDFTPLGLAEIHDDGSPVAGFGRHHLARVSVPYPASLEPTVFPDGSIVFFGPECCKRRLTVTRVSARGVTDTHFDAVAGRSLARLASVAPRRALSTFGVKALLPGPRGDLELFGEARMHGFELRLRRDGRIDTSFGDGGKRLVRYPVGAATAVPGGGAIAVSKLRGREGVLSLDRHGRVEKAFTGGGRFDLPENVEAAPPTLLRGGRVAVLFSHEETCRDCVYLAVSRIDLSGGHR